MYRRPTQPGCVLRPSNVVNLLKKERNLISDADIEACKNGFNTWAFVGDINSTPQLNCVFQSDDAQMNFLVIQNLVWGRIFMILVRSQLYPPRLVEVQRLCRRKSF